MAIGVVAAGILDETLEALEGSPSVPRVEELRARIRGQRALISSYPDALDPKTVDSDAMELNLLVRRTVRELDE